MRSTVPVAQSSAWSDASSTSSSPPRVSTSWASIAIYSAPIIFSKLRFCSESAKILWAYCRSLSHSRYFWPCFAPIDWKLSRLCRNTRWVQDLWGNLREWTRHASQKCLGWSSLEYRRAMHTLGPIQLRPQMIHRLPGSDVSSHSDHLHYRQSHARLSTPESFPASSSSLTISDGSKLVRPLDSLRIQYRHHPQYFQKYRGAQVRISSQAGYALLVRTFLF